MAINAELRKTLHAGMKLVGRYKGSDYQADVVAGDTGNLLYRLADGRDFGSPSAAGAALMGGIACNGWRFWSVAERPVQKPNSCGQRRSKARGAK